MASSSLFTLKNPFVYQDYPGYMPGRRANNYVAPQEQYCKISFSKRNQFSSLVNLLNWQIKREKNPDFASILCICLIYKDLLMQPGVRIRVEITPDPYPILEKMPDLLRFSVKRPLRNIVSLALGT